jgi:signal transduction histidine kinase
MRSQSSRELTSRYNVVLVRWVLIIATSYLTLFSRPVGEVPTSVGLFIAAYLASNVVLSAVITRVYSRRQLDIGVVLFDSVAVSVALALTKNVAADFFPVYFLVLFLGALTQRLGLLVGTAVLLSVVHLSTISQFVSLHEMLANGYLLRIPFLLAVALFFGYEVDSMSQRERAASAAARKRQRTESVSAVIHDLKNPLGVIQSLAELLLDGDAGALTSEQAALTRRIHASVQHVLKLAVNLLDATRIDAGRLTLLRAPAQLADIVERTVLRARSASDLKDIELRFSPVPRPPTSDLDALQIERVVANLLDNAIKYTPYGGTVTVTIAALPSELILDVCDNGPGIPPAELPAIFEKYRRRLATSGIDGSGLGLFIVKAIVEAHAGSVTADSVLGEGTRITVRLPTARADLWQAPLAVMPAALPAGWKLSWS